MITIEKLKSVDKNNMEDMSKTLQSEDLHLLIDLLCEKDDKIRYPAFLLLQCRSMNQDDVYLYWDIFREKLKSENSFQRSIGLMLIAENAKWDTEEKTEAVMGEYLACIYDDKPITVRQCIQGLKKIVPCKRHLNNTIADKLLALDIMSIKETMRKSVLSDILEVLIEIRKYTESPDIEQYIITALTGEILDKKTKKAVEEKL